jgi:hypothetical protein
LTLNVEHGTLNAVDRRLEARNVVLCTAAHVGFGYGMGLVDALTVMPLLLSSLGAGQVLIGMAWGTASAGWFLLQAPGMFLLGGRPRMKRFLIRWSFFTVIPTYLAIAAAVYLLAAGRPALCMALVLVLIAVRWLGEGASYPFWDDWLARLFSTRMRGMAFGLIAAAMGIGGALAALTAGQVRLRVAYPLNYALLFVGAAGFFGVMLAGLYRVHEPAPPQGQGGLTGRDLASRFWLSLAEPNYRNYLIGRILLTFGGGVAAFYAVHFRSPEGGGLADGVIITLGICLAIPQAIGSYALGRLGDRTGHKASVVIGAGAQVLSLLVACLGHGLAAAIAAFVLLGVALSASWASHLNMLFETCPHDSRVAHLTVSNVVLSPFLVLVPVVTGWLMRMMGVQPVIGLALIPAALGAAWMLLVVREPRTLALTRNCDDAGR